MVKNIDPILEDYVYGKRLGGKEKSIVEAIAGPRGKELLKERQEIDQEKISEALDKASLENIEDTTTKIQEPEKEEFLAVYFQVMRKKKKIKKMMTKKMMTKKILQKLHL